MLSSVFRRLAGRVPGRPVNAFRNFSTSPTVSSSPTGLKATNNKGFDSESYDHYQADDMKRIASGDPNKRGFTYLMLGGMRVAIATSGRVALLKLLDSMNASKDVLALASLEVEIANIPVGDAITVKWRGKPVFIRRRTPEEIAEAGSADLGSMRDPESDLDRVKDPEWLVVLGICTHLGCVPINGAGDYNGYFCPCHGSHYDTSGRIRKGPAPLNLEVPPYSFDEASGKLIVG
jgi:ubiquinol-cytochrome c reductase iron-sulfur subunit